VVRFFFFFSRCLFFDPLTFVVERPGLEEVSPVNMVLLAGRALVPAAAFSLIPDLTGQSKGEGDGLVPHALACTGGLVLESGVSLTEEMRLGSLILEVDSFVEAADAPAGMGKSFVEAA